MFFLYVIAHVDEENDFVAPVKIGVTNDINRRLREIQTGNPSKLELYAKIPFRCEKTAYEAEQHFHEIYKVNSHLQGEWFDVDPWKVFDIPISRMSTYKTIIDRYNEYIKEFKWKIYQLEMVLGEQDLIVEDIFRSELKDRNDRIYDKYSKIMCQKYKEVISEIEKIKSGKNEDGVLFGKPYWKNLAERK